MSKLDAYYIQNRKPVGNCVMWWAEGGKGYTCDLSRAGKFPKREAQSICNSRPDIDTAWHCEDIDRLSVQHFDFQKFRDITPLGKKLLRP